MWLVKNYSMTQDQKQCCLDAPRCNNSLRYQQVRYRDSFPCPSCNQLLYIPHAYTAARTWATLLISAAGLYFYTTSKAPHRFIGLRGTSVNVLRWSAEIQWTCGRKSQLRSTPIPNE